jgi:hypothetical protein
MMRFGQKWIITFELTIRLALLWGVSAALAQKLLAVDCPTAGVLLFDGWGSLPSSLERHSQFRKGVKGL